MKPEIEKYLQMQRDWYSENSQLVSELFSRIAGNVAEHNKINHFLRLFCHLQGPKILEYGCGPGVIIRKGLQHGNVIDGVDICENAINYVKEEFPDHQFWLTNGFDLQAIGTSTYDSVFSINCFQHIAVWEIRHNIIKEMHRVLKTDGVLIFQMGFGEGIAPANYRDNHYDAEKTNGYHDVKLTDPKLVVDELDAIGFKEVGYMFSKSITGDGSHPQWVFFYAKKK